MQTAKGWKPLIFWSAAVMPKNYNNDLRGKVFLKVY